MLNALGPQNSCTHLETDCYLANIVRFFEDAALPCQVKHRKINKIFNTPFYLYRVVQTVIYFSYKIFLIIFKSKMHRKNAQKIFTLLFFWFFNLLIASPLFSKMISLLQNFSDDIWLYFTNSFSYTPTEPTLLMDFFHNTDSS